MTNINEKRILPQNNKNFTDRHFFPEHVDICAKANNGY
jgi:hypothetical protein